MNVESKNRPPHHIVILKFFLKGKIFFNIQCVPLECSTDFMLQSCYQLITSILYGFLFKCVFGMNLAKTILNKTCDNRVN